MDGFMNMDLLKQDLQETPKEGAVVEKVEDKKEGENVNKAPEGEGSKESDEKEDTTNLTPEQIEANKQKIAAEEQAATAEKKATEALLKRLGVTTVEEAEEKLKTPDSPEVLAKKQEQYNSAVDNFAVTQEYMKRDEIIALANLRSATPESIAYNVFSQSYLEANKEATPEMIKQEFDLYYHLGSENEKLKAQGEASIKKVAAGVLGALESKYNSAKEAYDTTNSHRARVPEFKGLVQSAIKAATPDKLTVYTPEGSDPVTFEITDAERADIEKFIVKNTFEEFLDTAPGQPTQDLIKDKVEGFKKLLFWDKAMKTVFDAGQSLGRKTGSTTGAENSFENKSSVDAVKVDANDLTEADKEKTKGMFGGGR